MIWRCWIIDAGWFGWRRRAWPPPLGGWSWLCLRVRRARPDLEEELRREVEKRRG